jgi:hypothetical protein
MKSEKTRKTEKIFQECEESEHEVTCYLPSLPHIIYMCSSHLKRFILQVMELKVTKFAQVYRTPGLYGPWCIAPSS